MSVGETGGVVTEATIAGVVACLAVDQFLYGGGQNATVGVERMLTSASNRRPRIYRLEFDLLDLGRFENEVEGDGFVQLALSFDLGVDPEVEGMALGLLPQQTVAWQEAATTHKGPDALAEVGFVTVFTDDRAELVDQLGLCVVKWLVGGPFAQATDADVAGVYAVDDVMQGIGGVIGPIHNLALDAFELVEGCWCLEAGRQAGLVEDNCAEIDLVVVNEVVRGVLAGGGDPVAGRGLVFHYAIEKGPGRRHALGASGALVNQLGEDALCLGIAFKAAVGGHQLVEFAFAEMPEWWMSEVVCQTDGFGQVGVDVELCVQLVGRGEFADGAPDFGDFNRVGQAGAVKSYSPD